MSFTWENCLRTFQWIFFASPTSCMSNSFYKCFFKASTSSRLLQTISILSSYNTRYINCLKLVLLIWTQLSSKLRAKPCDNMKEWKLLYHCHENYLSCIAISSRDIHSPPILLPQILWVASCKSPRLIHRGEILFIHPIDVILSRFM